MSSAVNIRYRVTADHTVHDVLELATAQFCDRLGLADETADVCPLERFGKSGAALFRIDADRVEGVIKVAALDRVLAEQRSHDTAQVHFHAPPCFAFGEHESHGALLYQFHRDDGTRGKPAPTLKDDFDKALGARIHGQQYSQEDDIGRFTRTVTRALASLSKGNVTRPFPDAAYHKIYGGAPSYFRKEERVRPVIRNVWAQLKADAAFAAVGVSDPLESLDVIRERTPAKRLCRVAHGDFHGSNILLTADDDVTVIDFAWLRLKMDAWVDHVMLENSLRFMASPLPRPALASRLISQRYAEELMPSEPWDSVAPSLRDAYELMCACVNVIRQDAWSLAHSVDVTLAEHEFLRMYLESQLIVLSGQMQYPDYDRVNAVEYLSMIGKRVA
jgi:hypothetical protein